MLLPGIGGVIGNVGDHLIGGYLGGKSVGIAHSGLTRSQQVNHSRERGTEQIANVTIPSGTPAGTVILQALIAAPTIGVRLRAFSELWTKTRFRAFKALVTSSNPTVVGGNYTLAIDPDPVQTYVSGQDVPARLMALTQATKANAWADAEVTMLPNPIPLFNKFTFAGSSDAEIRQFACGVLVLATTTAYDTDCEYTVNVEWDVEFERPDTIETEGQVGSPVIFKARNVPVASFDSTNSTYTIDAANALPLFNTLPPPGTYETPGLNFQSSWTTDLVLGSAHGAISQIFVTATGGIIIYTLAPHFPPSTATNVTLVATIPTEYVIPGVSTPVVSTRQAMKLRKVGLALINGNMDPTPHLQWEKKVNEAKSQKQLRTTLIEALHHRRLENLKSLEMGELERALDEV